MIPGTVREEEETFEDDRAAVLVAVIVASTQRDRRRHRSLRHRDHEHRVVREDDHRVPMIGTILGTGTTQLCLEKRTLKSFIFDDFLKITSTEKAGGGSTTSRRSNLEQLQLVRFRVEIRVA